MQATFRLTLHVTLHPRWIQGSCETGFMHELIPLHSPRQSFTYVIERSMTQHHEMLILWI